MIRICKVCDVRYKEFFASFPDEDYCPMCEESILLLILEMKTTEDYGEEPNIQGEPDVF